jgi:hypothetical protein
MRVGVVALPEQEPLAIASTRGALDASRVLLVELMSRQDLHNAFLDGNVHAGVFSLDEALRLAGPPVSARIERFVGASHAPFSLMITKRFQTLADLRGHRIGLEAGRPAMAALRELLADGGLTLGDVELSLLDAESASLVLEQGQVDAALLYPPFSLRLASAGARTLARWVPPGDGELMVLVANARAHRLEAGQIDHVSKAWLFGASALRRLDSTTTAHIARREEIPPAEVAAALASEHYLGAQEDRRLRGPEGVSALDAALSTIASRWRALGVLDTVPPRERWLVSPRKRS